MKAASLLTLCLMAALLAEPARAAAAAALPWSGTPMLERTVRLRLWGDDLESVLRSLSEQAGVTVRVSPVLLAPEDVATRPLYLVADPVPVATALEMIARSLGGRFRVEGDRVRLVAGYEWVDESPELRSIPVVMLLAPGEKPEALEKRLREMARVTWLLDTSSGKRWEFRLRYLPTGRGDNELNVKLETYLPATLQEYVRQMLIVLDSDGDPIRPQAFKGSNTEAAADASARRMVSLPAQMRQARVAAILDDLALQTDWALGFDALPFLEQPPPPVDVNFGFMEGRAAAVTLSRALGFDGGAERWVDNVVWLSRSARTWDRTRPGRQILWENLPTRGYAAGALALALGGWDPLMAKIRENANPWIWDDPMTAMVYNPIRGVLAVRAPAETLAAVETTLRRMAYQQQSGGNPPPSGR